MCEGDETEELFSHMVTKNEMKETLAGDLMTVSYHGLAVLGNSYINELSSVMLQ